MISYFKLNEFNSNFCQEFRGGLACFLTMSYILLVNPQVLSTIGLAPAEIVVATSLSSGVGCLISGVFGNLPFGLAPGIGLSTYLAYGLVLGNGLSLSQAFTSVSVAFYSQYLSFGFIIYLYLYI